MSPSDIEVFDYYLNGSPRWANRFTQEIAKGINPFGLNSQVICGCLRCRLLDIAYAVFVTRRKAGYLPDE